MLHTAWALLAVALMVFVDRSNGVRYVSSVTPSYSLQVGVQQLPSYPPEFIAFPQNVDYLNHFRTPAPEKTQLDESRKNEEKREENAEEDEKKGVGNEQEQEGRKKYPNATQIPLALIEKLNQYDTVEEILENVVEGYVKEAPAIANRFGEVDGTEERSSAVKPKPALCMPELTKVKLAESNDPSVLYMPTCTRIERCGGCCKHPLLSCQPTETETINFVVHMFQYTGGEKFKFVRKEIVPIEKHLKCQCGCKIKEKDCNRFHKYNPTSCKCTCPNADERQKCSRESDKKLWNSKACACQCRDVHECSTGQRFDPHTCRCIIANLRRRYAQPKETGYDSNALTVAPLYEVINVNHDN